jgi:cytochrome c-type biogenesis protein CcmH
MNIILFWCAIGVMSLIAMAFIAMPLLRSEKTILNYPITMGAIVLLPIVAILFYWQVGSSSTLNQYFVLQKQAAAAQAMQRSLGTTQQIIAALKQHLVEDPKSARGWYLLGRVYVTQNQMDDAVAAFAKAYQLTPNDVDVMFQYAQALYLVQHSLQGMPNELLQKILQHDPQNDLAINLYAVAAYQAGDYQNAIYYWEKLLPKYAPTSTDGKALLDMIAKAQNALVKNKDKR